MTVLFNSTLFRLLFTDIKLGPFECVPPQLAMSVDWAVPTGKCVDASPLVARLRGGSCTAVANVVFIGSHSGLFFAITASDGQIIWKTQTGGRIESSACLSLCAKFVVFGKMP